MTNFDRDWRLEHDELIRLRQQQFRSQANARLLLLVAGLTLFWGVSLAALLGFLR